MQKNGYFAGRYNILAKKTAYEKDRPYHRKTGKAPTAAACFFVYAFEEMKDQLEIRDDMRFIFISTAFCDEDPENST